MRILEDITRARNGHYVHVIEVPNTDSMTGIVEQLANEWEDKYTLDEAIEFFDTLEVYYLNEDDPDNEELEQSVYDFSMSDYYRELNT